jgi:Cu+-exporting ATPase
MKDILQLKAALVIRLIILFITGLFSTYICVANDFKWPVIDLFNIETNAVSFLFINSVLGIISAFVSYTVIAGGLSKIFSLEADGDSILAVGVISSLACAMLMLFNTDLFQRNKLHIYIPVAIIALIFNTIGKIMIVSRTERNFKYISSDSEKYAVFQVENEDKAERFTKGALTDFPSLAAMKKTGFVNDFMKNSYAADMSDKLCRFAVPVVIMISLMSTLLSVFFNKASVTTSDIILTALTTFAASIGLCSSFALMIAVSYPLSKASKKHLEASAVIIGYPAVEEFSSTNSVLLDAGQLFPEGTVDFINLKQISSASIEDGILIAASLACHAGSILKPTFYKMLKGKTEMLYPVESYIYEDTLGLSGWIENKRVLLGTRELMVNHSIEGLPSTVKEKDYSKGNLVLYLSISGEITTMFIVRIKTSLGITKWLKEFERQDITVVLRSVDAIVSLNFLSELFDVSPDMFKLLPFRFHKSFDEESTYSSSVSSGIVCSGKFQSFAMLVSGAKRLHRTISIGMIITLASIGLGGIISLIMTLLSSINELTPSVLILYNFVWMFVVMAAQAFRKS